MAIKALVVRDRADRILRDRCIRSQAVSGNRPPGEGSQNVLLTLVILEHSCVRVGCEGNVILLSTICPKSLTIFFLHNLFPIDIDK